MYYTASLKHLSIPQAATRRLQFTGEPWLEEFSREAQILQAHVKNVPATKTFLLGCNIKK